MKGLLHSTYLRWLKSDKQMVVAVCLICLYMYVITPLQTCMEFFQNEPLQVLEPFLTFLCNSYCMPIFMLGFLVTVIDFPDLSGNAVFVIARLGKKRYLRSQLCFLGAAIFSYLLLLLLFSLIFTGMQSYLVNGWSNVMTNLQKELYIDLKIQYPLATIDLSVLNHFRPYMALIYSLLLTSLNLLLHGQLQIFLTVRFHRMVGITASILLLGGGLVAWASNSWVKWLFPLAHATIGWHYDPLYQQTLLPIWISFAYLIIGNILFYLAAQYAIRKKQLYFGGMEA